MSVSLLVPYRAEAGSVRERNWMWLAERWQRLVSDWELILGTDTGMPFSKTTAVNDAYQRSHGDILILIDADSWIAVEALKRAVAYARQRERLVIPWMAAHRLRRVDSDEILAMDPASPNPVTTEMKHAVTEYRPAATTAAMIAVLSRTAFEQVGGMDPRFRGWGAEDVSFALACETLLGPTKYLMHQAYALYHPRLRLHGRPVWENDSGSHNRELGSRYWRARGNPEAMRVLCDEHPLASSRLVECG